MKKKHKQREDFYSFYTSETDQSEGKPLFKIAQRRSSLLRIVVALFVGLLAASAWFGYLFFNERLSGSSDPVVLTLEGPSTAENGSPVEYVVSYRNISKTAITDIALFADYPPGFIVIESEPATENVKKNFWNIGVLEPGMRGTITIRGTLTGFEHDERTATISLQYTHPTYQSAFTLKDTRVTRIEAARAERLSITGPKTINAGSTVSAKIRYQDVSLLGNPDSVILKLSLPQGLSVEESQPVVSNKDTVEWNGFALSQTVRPDTEGGVLTLTLKANDTIQGDAVVGAQLLLRDAAGGDTVLLESRYELAVLRSDLALGVVSNGGTDAAPVVLGASHAFTLNVENRGNTTFRDVAVWLEGDSSVIDWDQSRVDGAERSNGRITWTGKQVEGLREIESGKTLALPFELAIKSKDTIQNSVPDEGIALALFGRIGARIDSDGEVANDPLDITGPHISLPIMSDARLRAFVRDVTEKNAAMKTFRVYYAITNTLYPLDDLSVSATIPEGVTWVGVNSRTAGDIAMDTDKREVTWTLNTLPSSVPRIDGSFDVALPASLLRSDQRIIEHIIFRARDSHSGALIDQQIEWLTSLQTNESL